jgi:EAL domain-containing protein (putative c-di-GMP-specific phosphodiesterase class I)
MTQWVVREVCRQLAAWQHAGLANVPVSINLDAKSLHDDTLIPMVEGALRDAGLPGAAIEFEVTESSLMSDLARVSQTLQQLRRLGIRLAIDDFGTGYSSLTYLKHFPVDILKIDRSFVQGTTSNRSDAALTTAIIAMGQSLELALIAEGVENWGQAEFLAQRGCHDVQGFLFARPLPGQDFADLLRLGLPGTRKAHAEVAGGVA